MFNQTNLIIGSIYAISLIVPSEISISLITPNTGYKLLRS